MSDKLKYSVIIPVYNAEKTLRRCVDSLLEERYPDVEIILVNDGSRDRSGEICREYASRESSIHYIDKENGGVSTARNAGLDAASGEYVLFVDSDDYVVPGFFSIIDRENADKQGDLIQFSHQFDNGIEIRCSLRKPVTAQGRETIMPLITDAICRKTLNPPWAKLYRRELIEAHSIRFPVGASVAEDRVFNIVYSFYIQSYLVSDQVIYNVNTENEESLTRGRHRDLQQQFDIAGQYFHQALDAAPLSPSEKDLYQRAYNFGTCRAVYHDAKLLIQDGLSWLTRQRRMIQLCDEINRKHMQYPRTRYCTMITLPVRLRLTWVIDAIAWKLVH